MARRKRTRVGADRKGLIAKDEGLPEVIQGVVRIYPSADSCMRLMRALTVEMHENWFGATG